MTSASYRFDRFVLDTGERQLLLDGTPVELNARYLDALVLMVRAPGRLVTKERFLDEVWRGVPVTDEALTQCIRTLRRVLGDDAARPRFIETVVKHGYRFVAPVEAVGAAPGGTAASPAGWRRIAVEAAGGTAGAVVAGIAGGLLYGFAAASLPLEPGTGAASVLMVVLCLCVVIAAMGGSCVSLGIAVARARSARAWPSVAGGAAAGLVIGAVGKLLGQDAFAVLIGQAPGGITGAPEGAVLGACAGLGVWLAGRSTRLSGGVALAALAGGVAGVVIPLLGGRMMAGSLALLGERFPQSRLRLDQMALFGENGFGLLSQMAAGGLEGALFAGCIAAGVRLTERHRG